MGRARGGPDIGEQTFLFICLMSKKNREETGALWICPERPERIWRLVYIKTFFRARARVTLEGLHPPCSIPM